jgi:hypothetical protein
MLLIWFGLSFYAVAQTDLPPSKRPTLLDPPSPYNIHHCAASLDSGHDTIQSIRRRPRIDATLIPYSFMRDGAKHVGFLAFEVNSDPQFIEIAKLKDGEELAAVNGDRDGFRFKSVNGIESVVDYKIVDGELKPVNARFYGERRNESHVRSIRPEALSKEEELAARESISEMLFLRAKDIHKQLNDESAAKPLAADAENKKGGGYRKYLSTLYGTQSAGHQGCNLFLKSYLKHKEKLSQEQANEQVHKMHQQVLAAVPVGEQESPTGPSRSPSFLPDPQTTTAELVEAE